jgi:hypothetical protein
MCPESIGDDLSATGQGNSSGWPGPGNGVKWIINDVDRVRAKQSEMLDIDERTSARWLETMRALVAEELSDEEFTVRRMAALKSWEKGRKLDQAQLHYRYDPRRRNPKLVEREVRKQLDKVREKFARLDALSTTEGTGKMRGGLSDPETPAQIDSDDVLGRTLATHDGSRGARTPDEGKGVTLSDTLVPFDPEDEAQGFHEGSAQSADPQGDAELRTPVRSLTGVSDWAIHLISDDMGIADVDSITDDEIRRFYIARYGITAAEAEQYVDLLKPAQP